MILEGLPVLLFISREELQLMLAHLIIEHSNKLSDMRRANEEARRQAPGVRVHISDGCNAYIRDRLFEEDMFQRCLADCGGPKNLVVLFCPGPAGSPRKRVTANKFLRDEARNVSKTMANCETFEEWTTAHGRARNRQPAYFCTSASSSSSEMSSAGPLRPPEPPSPPPSPQPHDEILSRVAQQALVSPNVDRSLPATAPEYLLVAMIDGYHPLRHQHSTDDGVFPESAPPQVEHVAHRPSHPEFQAMGEVNNNVRGLEPRNSWHGARAISVECDQVDESSDSDTSRSTSPSSSASLTEDHAPNFGFVDDPSKVGLDPSTWNELERLSLENARDDESHCSLDTSTCLQQFADLEAAQATGPFATHAEGAARTPKRKLDSASEAPSPRRVCHTADDASASSRSSSFDEVAEDCTCFSSAF